MFQKLVRLMVRLFFFALIAGVVGFVITRLTGGEDEDFEDFDDLESSFEFNETPVEIDVSGPATTNSSEEAAEEAPASRASNLTVALDEQTADGVDANADSEGSEAADEGSDTDDQGDAREIEVEGPRLIDIKGIGPSYEGRLRNMGVESLSDLLDTDTDKIVESASVIGGAAEVEDWKEQARAMTTDEHK